MKTIEYLKKNGVDLNKCLELFGDVETYNETLRGFHKSFDGKKIIDDVLTSDEDIKDSLGSVADKYMRNKQPTKEVIAKLGRFLSSRGYDWDSIKTYISNLNSEDEY